MAYHNTFDVLLKETHKRIGEDVTDNMDFLKYNHPWIGDLLFGRFENPKMYEYFISDILYVGIWKSETIIGSTFN